MEEFSPLRPRAEDDPQRLCSRVMESLDHLFSTRGATYLSGQREALPAIVKTVLNDGQTGIFAIPLVPGGGKSTVMRALLTVFEEVFRNMSDPIAKRLGGVIIVVEKTAEGDELEQRDSRPWEMRHLKRMAQGSWNHAIRIPFDRLNRRLSRETRDAAVLTPEELSNVGMTGSALRETQEWLTIHMQRDGVSSTGGSPMAAKAAAGGSPETWPRAADPLISGGHPP